MDSRATKRPTWMILVLSFIILRTLFALVWDVYFVDAKSMCQLFANTIFNQLGASEVERAQCEPDGDYATVGHESGSFLILDMGEGNEIIDDLGVDFYYYERPFNPGIQLDQVEVAVAQDNGLGTPASFIVVFIWGDDNFENNGTIPLVYNPEEPNKPINTSDLLNQTGIGIDIGNDNSMKYRFVRFQTHPTDATPENAQLVEVDAVESVYHPPQLTETVTPLPLVTPSTTPLPTSTETPFDVLVMTDTPLETPTSTYVTNEAITLTEAETLTPTETPSVIDTLTSFVSTDTYTPTYTSVETFTATSTPELTFTPTIAPMPTATRSPGPNPTKVLTTNTPIPVPNIVPATLRETLTLLPTRTAFTTDTSTTMTSITKSTQTIIWTLTTTLTPPVPPLPPVEPSIFSGKWWRNLIDSCKEWWRQFYEEFFRPAAWAQAVTGWLFPFGLLLFGLVILTLFPALRRFVSKYEEFAKNARNPNTIININTCNKEALEALEGIGTVLAQRIIEYRGINGYFITVEDLIKVQGIGLAKLDTIRDRVKI